MHDIIEFVQALALKVFHRFKAFIPAVIATGAFVWVFMAFFLADAAVPNGGGAARAQAFNDPSAPVINRPRPERRTRRTRRAPPAARLTSPAAPPRAAAPAAASPPPAADGGDTPPPPPAVVEFPPYEVELVRLSEILGAVYFLRDLCGAEDGPRWRRQMEAIVAAEPDNEAWRGRLVQSFNRGYNGYARSYRQCTPAAVVAVNRYMAEGAELSRTIQIRYSN